MSGNMIRMLIDATVVDKELSALSAERIELANELDKANYDGNWYCMIKHLRNYSLHVSLLSLDSLDVF
jgi:hypothetical protein